ncbi:MAG: sigma-70 family RNA polymerase sigma factor [Lachnospiraceae bacterium]|jgi:RNA polymerase sigma-70 factor (ECF subfamily)|nr:sigma-70 family RNA polymerase sigma factor [Lachnospiraceae bacterium]
MEVRGEERGGNHDINNRWEQALRRYGDMVYRLALVRTGHKQDAEDLTQNVFLIYASRLRQGFGFEGEEHEKAWLIRVTINQSKNLFASAWFRHRTALSEEISVSQPACSDVYFAVQSLPERYRTVIHLYYYEGYDVKEIGSLLGKKENTVKSLLKRGRDRLRRLLA